MSAKKSPPPAVQGPFNSPFSGLAQRLGTFPDRPLSPEPADRKVPSAPSRAVVRLERKGHGGKVVTVVEGLELNTCDLLDWLRELKALLGCGGVAQDGVLLVQGDQRERAAEWLRARGVKKVSVSH